MNAKDIVSKEFDTVKRGGYDAAEVDTFLKDVSIEYKKLQNENEELEKKLEVLAEKIREYRKDEDALRDALLIAKKQGIAVVNEAKEDAEKIRKDAQEKAEKTIKDADVLAAKKKELGEKNLAEANAKAKQTVDDANDSDDAVIYGGDQAEGVRPMYWVTSRMTMRDTRPKESRSFSREQEKKCRTTQPRSLPHTAHISRI